ncbi:hypothetical protein ACFFWC_16805 [Plantactinospora siamensis]|uniref:DUF4878 domain-containing protein n=1 Tax=Plantactinospora siamensis TaxID=555372 RepID=A0ABV6NV67_9ACTN
MTYPSWPQVSAEELRARPRKGRLSGGAAAAIVAILVCGLGLPIAGAILWSSGGPDLDGPRNAADRFLQRVEAGDDGVAYASLCADMRLRMTVAQFVAAVEDLGRPVSHSVVGAVFLDEAGNSAAVDVRVTSHTSAGRAFSLTVAVVEGEWQVCDHAFP